MSCRVGTNGDYIGLWQESWLLLHCWFCEPLQVVVFSFNDHRMSNGLVNVGLSCPSYLYGCGVEVHISRKILSSKNWFFCTQCVGINDVSLVPALSSFRPWNLFRSQGFFSFLRCTKVRVQGWYVQVKPLSPVACMFNCFRYSGCKLDQGLIRLARYTDGNYITMSAIIFFACFQSAPFSCWRLLTDAANWLW